MKKYEESIFSKDFELPQIVQKKADEAFYRIKTEAAEPIKGESAGKKKLFSFRKLIPSVIVAAACAVLVIAAVSANGSLGKPYQNDPAAVNSNEPGSEPDNRPSLSFPDFSVAAYAEGIEIAEASEGHAIFADAGFGADGYTGILFSLMGSGITDVTISIDKGELYSAVIEHSTEDSILDWMAQGMPDMDGDPSTDTLVETFELKPREEDTAPQWIKMYQCKKRGTEIKEKYDANTYYGLYIPDSISKAANAGADLAAAKHEMLRVFDGAVLTVSVSNSDGSSSTKKYELTAAKLAQDPDGKITQEVWTGGAEGAFVYGILAEEK